jgi:putative PIN family toxin of toxin-antitoxin system
VTRLLVDTSVLLAAVVGRPTSPPARLLVGLREGAGELLTCETILRELRAGLAKPYFRSRVDPREADEIAAALELLAVIVPEPATVVAVLRDPTDDFLIATARAAAADSIVTSDHDLLHHEPPLAPPAIDARQACELLKI